MPDFSKFGEEPYGGGTWKIGWGSPRPDGRVGGTAVFARLGFHAQPIFVWAHPSGRCVIASRDLNVDSQHASRAAAMTHAETLIAGEYRRQLALLLEKLEAVRVRIQSEIHSTRSP